MHRKSMEVAQHLGEPTPEEQAELEARKALFLKNSGCVDLGPDGVVLGSSRGGDNNNDSQNVVSGNHDDFRSNSIAALRARAHEHSVRLLQSNQSSDSRMVESAGDDNVFVDWNVERTIAHSTDF